MIRIVNWLLTRKCNIDCEYCAIVKDYRSRPSAYPKMKHYIKNEMSTKVVINALAAFKHHNPNVFHIFYGGEPLLRKDLPDIINYCNDNEIFYTIISNNTPEIQPLIKRLFEQTNFIEGFTSSVDPIFNNPDAGLDRVKKSIEGLRRLKEIQNKGSVKDVVAEITVMKENQHLLHELVSDLSEDEIYSDITFVDIAKSSYYDFSNVHDPGQLVQPTWKLAKSLLEIINDDKLYVHMKDVLIPKMFDTLPSNFDCELENNIHNVTVDADGTMRLCLRIKGSQTPRIHVKNLFDKENSKSIVQAFYSSIDIDKIRLCRLCNHSCLMMSSHIDTHEDGEGDLVHMDKREG